MLKINMYWKHQWKFYKSLFSIFQFAYSFWHQQMYTNTFCYFVTYFRLCSSAPYNIYVFRMSIIIFFMSWPHFSSPPLLPTLHARDRSSAVNRSFPVLLLLWVARGREILVSRFFSISRFSARNGGWETRNRFSSFFA